MQIPPKLDPVMGVPRIRTMKLTTKKPYTRFGGVQDGLGSWEVHGSTLGVSYSTIHVLWTLGVGFRVKGLRFRVVLG